MTQQRATTQAYRSLIADSRVASSISAGTNLSPEALNEAFNTMAEVLRGWIDFYIDFRGIQDKDRFRFNTARRAF